MSNLVRGKKRKKKKKKEKKWKGPRIRKIVSISSVPQRAARKTYHKAEVWIHGAFLSALPVVAQSHYQCKCLLDPLAASLTFSVLSSWCELLTRS